MDKSILDKSIATLNTRKDEWASLPIAERIPLFQGASEKTAEVADNWVATAVKAKSIQENSPLVGEEWASGPWALIYGIESMIGTLRSLEKGKNPPIGKVRTSTGGQLIADIFPYNIYHRLLLSGIRAEVWMQDDVIEDNFQDIIEGDYDCAGESQDGCPLGNNGCDIVNPMGTIVDYFDVTVFGGPHAITIEDENGYRIELTPKIYFLYV